jgi:hypothetical protein
MASASPPAASTPRARASTPSAAKPTRCSDILQKASLESLSADEIAYLKKECR